MELLDLKITFPETSPDFDVASYQNELRQRVTPIFEGLFGDTIEVQIDAGIGSLWTRIKVFGALPPINQLKKIVICISAVGAFQQGLEYVGADIVQACHWVATEAAMLAGGFPRPNTKIEINSSKLLRIARLDEKMNLLASEMLKAEAPVDHIHDVAVAIAEDYIRLHDYNLNEQDKKMAEQIVFSEREHLFAEILKIHPKYASANIMIVFKRARLDLALPLAPVNRITQGVRKI
jgi:hypothetical protein